MELLLTSTYAPFAAALAGLLILGLIELIGLLLVGAGLSDLADLAVDVHALPDLSVTNWLLIKELPLAVILMLAFGGFGVTGMTLQMVLTQVQGTPAPFYLAGPLALVGSVLFLNRVGRLIAPLFKTTTTAVSETTLLGRIGTLLSPRAARGFAGEVKVLDEHGQTHYLMVEPQHDGDEFKEGDQVQLMAQSGPYFLVQRFRTRS